MLLIRALTFAFLISSLPIICMGQGGAPPIHDPGEPEPVPPSAPCPEVSEQAVEGVQNYLTLRYHSSEVEALGLDHLSREDVEPVTNEEACGALMYEMVNNPGIQGDAAPYGWERHFLQAGGYYFVLLLPDHPDDGLRVYLGPGFIHIFGRHHMNLILSRGPDPNPFEQ